MRVVSLTRHQLSGVELCLSFKLSMEWLRCVGLYTVLCKLYLFLGMRSERTMLKLALKCTPIIFLLGVVLSSIVASIAPVTSAAPGSSQKISRLFWGLLFSCIGDAYLVLPSYFLYGIVAFTIAQTIYISLFGGHLAMVFEVNSAEIMSGLAITFITTVVFLYILPKLKHILVLPVTVYCALISLMLWSAIVQLQRRATDLTFAGAVGAGLFYTSDVLLALNRWKIQFPFAQVLIMVTYYSAQLFIASSVIRA